MHISLGTNFNKTFAHVARLEFIRMLISIAYYLKLKLYQMDVNSAFLNGYLKEKNVCSTTWSFHNLHYPQNILK